MLYMEALKVVIARTEQNLAACETALRDGTPDDVDMQETRYERSAAQAALDYLRGELAQQQRYLDRTLYGNGAPLPTR